MEGLGATHLTPPRMSDSAISINADNLNMQTQCVLRYAVCSFHNMVLSVPILQIANQYHPRYDAAILSPRGGSDSLLLLIDPRRAYQGRALRHRRDILSRPALTAPAHVPHQGLIHPFLVPFEPQPIRLVPHSDVLQLALSIQADLEYQVVARKRPSS